MIAVLITDIVYPEGCLFRSAAAKEALGVGKSEWVVEQCTVSEDGRPSCCTGQLQVLSAADGCGHPPHCQHCALKAERAYDVLSAEPIRNAGHEPLRSRATRSLAAPSLRWWRGASASPMTLRGSSPTRSPVESAALVVSSLVTQTS